MRPHAQHDKISIMASALASVQRSHFHSEVVYSSNIQEDRVTWAMVGSPEEVISVTFTGPDIWEMTAPLVKLKCWKQELD